MEETPTTTPQGAPSLAQKPPASTSQAATTPRLSLKPIYIALVLTIGILLGVGGYAGYREFSAVPTNPTPPTEELTSAETCYRQLTAQSNPSAQYCGCMGGTYTIAQNEQGEYGICRIGGAEYEGWDYFCRMNPTDMSWGACGQKTQLPEPAYTCPESEWIDCSTAPPNAGIRFECTDEYLSWARVNCPSFQGTK